MSANTTKPAAKVKFKLTAVITHDDKECKPGTEIQCSKELAAWLTQRDKGAIQK